MNEDFTLTALIDGAVVILIAMLVKIIIVSWPLN